MRTVDGRLVVAATDLSIHDGCHHRTQLEIARARGELAVPDRDDPMATAVQRRGHEVEQRHLELLRTRGLEVVEIHSGAPTLAGMADAEATTLAAMRGGADVIYQAAFFDGMWSGRADFLIRVERSSDLGGHSYEVHDTKLAAHLGVEAMLQLAEYSSHVTRLQGREAERSVAVLGTGEEAAILLTDCSAYHRSLRRRMLADIERRPPTLAQPVAHCSICEWHERCAGQWRRDDALCLLQGITAVQRARLTESGIDTIAALAGAPERIERMPVASLARLRTLAGLQLTARQRDQPVLELVDAGDSAGLALLPEPAVGDLFFDIEGDPLWPGGGLEYLLGLVGAGQGEPPYLAIWAHDRVAERAAFERLVDIIGDRRRAHPDMHVYHYAAYEVSAVKRLAARHATREVEVDALLRAGTFVDLLPVVRNGLRTSLPSNSLKAIERFYAPHRDGDVADAGTSVAEYERWLLDGDQSILESIQDYNRFDCVSTQRLRDWLEERRLDLALQLGRDLPRPEAADPAAGRGAIEEDGENARLRSALERAADSALDDEATALRLLGHLLEFHRREDRSMWWAYFAHGAMTELELIDDPEAIGGIRSLQHVGMLSRSREHRFTFAREQEHRVRVGDDVCEPLLGLRRVGTVTAVGDGVVDLKLAGRVEPDQIRALWSFSVVQSTVLTEALRALAERALAAHLDAPGFGRASFDLLNRWPPRLLGGPRIDLAGDDTPAQAAVRLVTDLDDSVLPIQGPPGSGKTHTAGAMAVALLREPGAVVGITGPSHRVISNLLEQVMHDVGAAAMEVPAIQRCEEAKHCGLDGVARADSSAEVVAALDGGARIVAGTPWLFAHESLRERIEVLFIDEAGQMSLANALAASTSARNLVLLGDPQQLPQVLTGVHPPGADASALGHVLRGDQTMPAHRGLFLDVSWRMSPAVCSFVSELSYDGRLHPHPDNDRIAVDGLAGLEFEPVASTGCAGHCPEEAGAVAALVERLLGTEWTDRAGTVAELTLDDIMVVTPFNAQIQEIRRAVPATLEVGTVDSFQGREAAVVIYSLACSTAEDAPRGVDFLLDRNRLNVAVSRAKARIILVASPAILEFGCSRPDQVTRLNGLCRFVELARTIEPARVVGSDDTRALGKGLDSARARE